MIDFTKKWDKREKHYNFFSRYFDFGKLFIMGPVTRMVANTIMLTGVFAIGFISFILVEHLIWWLLYG